MLAVSGVASAQTQVTERRVTLHATALTVNEGDTISVVARFNGKTGGTTNVRIGVTGTAVLRVPATVSATDSITYDLEPTTALQNGRFVQVSHTGVPSAVTTLSETTFQFRIINDSALEGDETFTLTANQAEDAPGAPTSNPIWLPSPTNSLTFTIRGNDGSEALLGGADASVDEGQTIQVPVEFRGEARTQASTVNFSIGGTATAADYTVDTTPSNIGFNTGTNTGTAVFSQTNESGTISIAIASDADIDPAETLIVTLTSHMTGSTPRTVSSAARTYTITDTTPPADSPPAFGAGVTQSDLSFPADAPINAVVLPEATGGDGELSYALTTPPSGLVFTAATRTLSGTPDTPAGAVMLTYTVSDADTNMAAGDTDTLTFSVTVEAPVVVTPPGVTISESTLTVAEGNSNTYTIVLDTDPGGAVTITPSITPAGHDLTLRHNGVSLLPSGVLTFTSADWNVAKLVSVSAGMDGDTTNDAAQIRHAVSGYGSVTADDVIVTVVDTTAADTAPAFLAADLPVPDQVYTVNAPIDNLVLPVATGGNGDITYSLDTSAVPGLAFDADTRTLSGMPTAVAGAVVLTYIASDADTNRDDDDAARLTFSVTVQAASAAPVVSVRLSTNSLTLNEGGRPGIYTAVLSAAPPSSGDVIIAAVVPDGEPLTIEPQTLTFGSGNWSVPQAFTATVIADTAVDNEPPITVSHTATGGGIDPGLSDLNIVRLTVMVRDLPAGVTISPLTLPVNQESTGRYTVTLDAAPSGGTNVMITPSSGDTSVATVSATPLVFGAGNWETPQTVEVRGVSGGTTRITHAVTHSGNYASVTADPVSVTVSEVVIASAENALNRVILPEITRAMSAPQTGAIARRVGQARSGAGGIDSPGGYSAAAWAAEAIRSGAANGNEFDGKALLGASDFVLPLGAADGGGMLDAGAAMWGGGEFLQLGGKSGNIEWDGDLLSVNAGVDGKLSNDLLAGLMLSWNEARVGYIDDTTDTRERGDYDLDMVSVHPYIGTSMMDGRLDWWATLGFGSGDLEIRNKTNNTSVTSDVTLQMLGVGGNSRLLARGDGELRLRAEAFTTRTEVEGSKSSNRRLSELKADARRVRVALQARKAGVTVGGGLLEPSMELGYRYDGGDGETGGGIEVGGALRYINTERGLTLEGYTRALMSHSGDYDEIGLGGHMRLAQGADGQGLSLSLTPGYGSSGGGGYGGGAEEIWQNGLSDDTETDLQAHLNARVGYGLSATAFMLTPYGEMALGEEVQNYRLGLSWGLGALFDLNLVGEREESDSVGVEHAIWLKGEMRF